MVAKKENYSQVGVFFFGSLFVVTANASFPTQEFHLWKKIQTMFFYSLTFTI